MLREVSVRSGKEITPQSGTPGEEPLIKPGLDGLRQRRNRLSKQTLERELQMARKSN
jgi:hypothetical protein